VVTGEEDEETVYQVRGKLFVLSEQNQWSERGTGLLKLNVRKTDGRGARLGEWRRVQFPLPRDPVLTDHLSANHDSDEEGRSVHVAFEHDPL
jgi:hypothetical protein